MAWNITDLPLSITISILHCCLCISSILKRFSTDSWHSDPGWQGALTAGQETLKIHAVSRENLQETIGDPGFIGYIRLQYGYGWICSSNSGMMKRWTLSHQNKVQAWQVWLQWTRLNHIERWLTMTSSSQDTATHKTRLAPQGLVQSLHSPCSRSLIKSDQHDLHMTVHDYTWLQDAKQKNCLRGIAMSSCDRRQAPCLGEWNIEIQPFEESTL